MNFIIHFSPLCSRQYRDIQCLLHTQLKFFPETHVQISLPMTVACLYHRAQEPPPVLYLDQNLCPETSELLQLAY